MKNKLIKSESKLIKIIVCFLCSIILKVILILISALIISKNDFSPEKIYIFWFIISAISSLISGFFAGKIFRNKGFLWGAVSGISGAAVLILILLFFSKFNFNLVLLLILPIELLLGAAGGIISSNLKQ